MDPINIFGDSHVACIRNGVLRLEATKATALLNARHVVQCGPGKIIDEFVLDLADGRCILSPLIQDRFAWVGLYDFYGKKLTDKARKRPTVMCFGFGLAHELGFNPAWKGIDLLPDDVTREYVATDHASGPTVAVSQRVSVGLIRALIKDRLKTLYKGLRMLTDQGMTIELISGPPPIPDRSYITKQIASFDTFPSAYLRLAIYREIVKALGEDVKTLGCTFTNLSGAYEDREGFLREEYWGDGVHGNVDYGLAIAREIEKRFEGAASAA